MRLTDLQIDGFGKLNDEKIVFTDGINLVTGRNEAGKSTVYACIRAMFYGMVRARGVAALTDTYSHYKPWLGGKYGASLRVEDNGHVYRIDRDFLKDPVGCTVFDETAMEAVPYGDRFVRGLLLEMSEETYDNTISIGRLKPDRDGNLGSELRKYIVNMDTTGSRALNCTRARAHLNEQKRRLAENIAPDAAKQYAVNCSEIKRLEKSINEHSVPAWTAAAGIAAGEQAKVSSAQTDAVLRAAAEMSAADNDAHKTAADKPSDSMVSDRAAQDRESGVSLQTEIECLKAEVNEGKEFLRRHNARSAAQVTAALDEYVTAAEDYKKTASGRTIVIFRALYIAFFVLTVLGVIAVAFIYGSGYPRGTFLGSLGLEALLFVLGAASLAACIISKKRQAKKTEKLSMLLERYSGYSTISGERIDRVRGRLEGLNEKALKTESDEAKLAELTAGHSDKETVGANAVADPAGGESAGANGAVQAAAADAALPEKTAAAASASALAAAPESVTAAAPGMQGVPVSGVTDAAVNDSIIKINSLRTENTGLKELLRKNDAINEEIDAIDLALEKLDELSDTMKDSLGVHLNARASEYIKEITKGAYDSLSVDDDLNVFMNTKDRMVPIEQVSNGTSDQIYMALRLAGARLVQNGEDRLPLIFDDSFVNYDDERLGATLSWLAGEYKGQVVIFSCQSREEETMCRNSLTFNPIHL